MRQRRPATELPERNERVLATLKRLIDDRVAVAAAAHLDPGCMASDLSWASQVVFASRRAGGRRANPGSKGRHQ